MGNDADDVPFHVFLDTQSYYSEQFDWSARNFASLRERTERGSIVLLTSSIVVREVHKGIRSRLNEFVQSLQNAARRSGVARSLRDVRVQGLEALSVDPPTFEALRVKAEQFFSDMNVETLEAPEGALDRCLDMYFSGTAPFGSKDKKAELPDAINLLSLEHFASKADVHVFVVSADEDWKRACEDRPRLTCVRHLSEILNRAIRAEWQSDELFPEDDLLDALKNQEAALKIKLASALMGASRVNLGDGDLAWLDIDLLYIGGFAATTIWDRGNKLEVEGELFHDAYWTAGVSIDDDELNNVIEHDAEGKAEDLVATLTIEVTLDGPITISILDADYRDGLNIEVPLKF